MTKEGGGQKSQKNDDVFYERPLTVIDWYFTENIMLDRSAVVEKSKEYYKV